MPKSELISVWNRETLLKDIFLTVSSCLESDVLQGHVVIAQGVMALN